MGLIVLAILLVELVAAGAVWFWWVVPKSTPIRPLGPAAPYGTAGFLGAGVACLIMTGAVVMLDAARDTLSSLR